MKSRVHPTYKTKYRVKNWASYDRALVRRGDVTVWFSAAAIAAWEPAGVGRRGGQLRYSDLAIETALTIRSIIGTGLRARTPGGQRAEALLACNILNRMTDLGGPESYDIGR